nr:M1 family metallopeptidase [Flexivirga meconopsidis]
MPGHGDPSYTVRHYDLDLDYALESNSLKGRAVLTIEALEPVRQLTLDLHALNVVKVTGPKAGRHTHRGGRLNIRLTEEVSPGETTTLTVTYRGVPRTVPDKIGDAGWEELTDGVIVASQPGGAPSWFPCNDRPDAKSTYRLAITVANDYLVVAGGERTDLRRRAGRTTWTYEQRNPMATYLATVQIGRYDEIALPGSVPLTAAVPPARRAAFQAAFADQPAMLEFFSRCFGPYPFDSYRVVVTDDALEIPLEAGGLSIFGSNLLNRSWDAQRLIAHELAHQWFGNAVTLRRLHDIWLHEGFACYSEWLWSEESGGPSADARAREHWSRLRHHRFSRALGDPGIAQVFDDWVYKRGALTLHAIRRAIGDESFFALLRTWIDRHRGGNVTTGEFVALADELGHPQVAAIVDAWVYETPLPALV